MNTDRLAVRLRAVTDEWFVLVVAVLLAVALFGGWMAYSAYAEEPEAETEEQTVEAWSSTGGFSHSAEVQRPNEVFEVDERLSNQPAYFTRVAPELEGEFTHSYSADSGDVTVDLSLERQTRAVDDDSEYWSTGEPLNSTTREGVEPGEEVRGPFAIDVPAMENETDRIEASLGSSPGDVETVVVAHVGLEGTIDGETVSQTDSYELLVEPDGDTYRVDGPAGERQTAERTAEVEATGAQSAAGPIPGAIVTVLSLATLGALAVGKSKDTLAPAEVDLERLRLENERAEFDDWISTGSIPEDVSERTRVEIDTLEDVVDVAVDHDRRVIEDREAEGVYYVLEDELLYVYERDALAEDAERAGLEPPEGTDPLADDEG